MSSVLRTTAVFMFLSLSASASGDEATLKKALEVATLAQAKSLAAHTTSVRINYTSEIDTAGEFTEIMSTLARYAGIRHLELYPEFYTGRGSETRCAARIPVAGNAQTD